MSVAGLTGLRDYIEGDIAKAMTAAMRETMPVAKAELRSQVTGAGLGNRLANTWRGEVYPGRGQSITPAGYLHSNAPDIIDAFNRGAQIMPLNGKRFLWIPTDNVPRAIGRRGSTRRMTPDQVEIAFNQDLFIRRGQRGRMLAFVNAVAARNRRGFRQATRGRLAQGRAVKPVLMFTLVPTVRLPKALDLDGVATRWAARFEAAFNRRLTAG